MQYHQSNEVSASTDKREWHHMIRKIIDEG